jgi:NADPH:quinone reductase-like Zn-dependent oxidoreductase
MENLKQDGRVMGAEGSGFIEAVGEGVDQALVRRKVIFACHSWSQFVVKKFDEVILLDDSVDMR